MKTYRGERTEHGCEVKVNGEVLQRRSDLSGSATSAFDWGFIGTGQLSMALLSDFLGDDAKAKAMCPAFEKKVVAELPYRSWTLTGRELHRALNGLMPDQTAVAANDSDAAGAAFGDMPIETVALQPSSNIVAASGAVESGLLPTGDAMSPDERATAQMNSELTIAAGKMADAANDVATAAAAVGDAAHQVAHASDQPNDEPMSTANRAADQKADATNRLVDAAAALARTAGDEAKRVVAALQKPA